MGFGRGHKPHAIHAFTRLASTLFGKEKCGHKPCTCLGDADGVFLWPKGVQRLESKKADGGLQ